ncbi:MAG TPA: phosphatase PAP2 family protein [Myxococcota bacterium]|nr:phosphatase PAP2 family protein [Myxococcota bacterium]
MSYRTFQNSRPGSGFEPMDFVVLGFLLALIAVVAAFSDRLPDSRTPLVAFATAIVGYIAMVRMLFRLNPGPTVSLLIRSAGLYVVFPFVYMHFDMVVEFLNPFRAETTLMAIDRFMFMGTNPNAALQSLLTPWAVNILQVCYAVYYTVFMFALIMLPFRQHQRFAAFLTSVALLFAASFTGYILVPARSPYVIAQLPEFSSIINLTQSVSGHPFVIGIREAIHNASNFRFDCFPSGHTAGPVLVFLTLFSWRKSVALALAPFFAAIVFSTLYLQYHYVIDVIAGAAVAVGVFFLGRFLVERFPFKTGSTRQVVQ